jgi:hypothetical protein
MFQTGTYASVKSVRRVGMTIRQMTGMCEPVRTTNHETRMIIDKGLKRKTQKLLEFPKVGQNR